MRRNQDVPAKKSSRAAFHRPGAALPTNHFSLSASSFSSFSLECRHQNIPIKENTAGKLEVSGNEFLFQVTPFFRTTKQFSDLFDSEIWSRHKNLLCSPNLLLIHQSSTPKPPHTKTIFVHKSNLTIRRRINNATVLSET